MKLKFPFQYQIIIFVDYKTDNRKGMYNIQVKLYKFNWYPQFYNHVILFIGLNIFIEFLLFG